MKGEYIRVSPENGRIAVCKEGTGISFTTIAEVRKSVILNEGNLSKWFLKYYLPWEKKFAAQNPDKYQELINVI